MKTIQLFTVLVLFAPTFAMAGQPPQVISPTSHDQAINIEDAVVPIVASSTTDTIIVISGYLTNGCYQFKNAVVESFGENFQSVHAIASVRSGICPMFVAPYSREVDLGKLVRGDHTIRFVNSDGTYWEGHLITD